jgi:hypothetical protein
VLIGKTYRPNGIWLFAEGGVIVRWGFYANARGIAEVCAGISPEHSDTKGVVDGCQKEYEDCSAKS